MYYFAMSMGELKVDRYANFLIIAIDLLQRFTVLYICGPYI